MRSKTRRTIVVTLLLCALGITELRADDRDPPHVDVAGDTLRYSGAITTDGLHALFAIHANHDIPIKWLAIDSGGGEINLAMDLGDWVYANALNVRVADHCLSSCANYVFTAGPVKVIESGAIVAWHGSAIQDEKDSRAAITNVIESQILARNTAIERPAVKAKLLDETLDYLQWSRARQARFFEKIGVDERITTIGEDNPEVRDFWFLSVVTMARFGIHQVVAPSNYSRTDTARFGPGTIIYIDVPSQ